MRVVGEAGALLDDEAARARQVQRRRACSGRLETHLSSMRKGLKLRRAGVPIERRTMAPAPSGVSCEDEEGWGQLAGRCVEARGTGRTRARTVLTMERET